MTFKKTKVTILECTLRDGSYAIDYQFTAADTAILAAGLEKAGFKLIEIGHGLGLGASSSKYGIAAATDEDYFYAAKNSLKKAKFGMFCIPGIAKISDLLKANKNNMGFLRVGTNVTEAEEAGPFIKEAKQLGMLVSSNLMKSYALTPLEFAKKVKLVYKFGADIICVVDSAGGMLPQEVYEYVRIVKNETGALIGFHGHDNLRLAVINSIEAVKAGATIIDSSLQGMGRSAGNAQTEILIVILEKMGYDLGIDLYKTLDLGEKIIKPIVGREKGVDSISVILGASQFHSSFMKMIYKHSQKYSVDPRELVVEVSKINRVNVNDKLVDKVAKDLKPLDNQRRLMNFDFDLSNITDGQKKENLEETAISIANEMISLSKKTGKSTIFTIAKSLNKNKKFTTFPFMRYNEAYIIGNAEVVSENDSLRIIKTIDVLVDFILIDYPLYHQLCKKLDDLKSTVLPYSDCDAQVISLCKLINFLHTKNQPFIFITGYGYLTRKMIHQLLYQGNTVINDDGFKDKDFYSGLKGKLLPGDSKSIKKADFIVGTTPFEISITEDLINLIKSDAVIIDAGPGSISQETISYGIKKGFSIYRIDMRAGLFGEIESVLKTYQLKNNIIGENRIKGIRVVSGGVIGKRGDIVLDSVINPTRIIGVADGKGGLISRENSQDYSFSIKTIRNYIAQKAFL